MHNQQPRHAPGGGGILPQNRRQPEGFGFPPGTQPDAYAAVGGYHPDYTPTHPQQYPGNQMGQMPQMQPSHQPSYIHQLMTQIALNQSQTGIPPSSGYQEGFNGYTYQRAKPTPPQNNSQQNSFYGNTRPPENGANSTEFNQEQYELMMKERSARAAHMIYSQLHNKMNRPYETVREVLEYFKSPGESGQVCGVVSEYIDEINNNIHLYRYCCTYTCILLTALFTERALMGQGDEIERNPELIGALLTDAATTVIALQFLDWLEKHPSNVMLVNRLLPKTLRNIENLENKMEGIERTILSVGSVRMPVSFPWKRGVLQRVRQVHEAGAATLDFYNLYNQPGTLRSQWGNDRSMAKENIPPEIQERVRHPLWYEDYKKALFADEGGAPSPRSGDSFYRRADQVIMLNPVVNNWDDTRNDKRRAEESAAAALLREETPQQEREEPEMSEVEERLEAMAAQLSFDRVHTFNPLQWFVPLPDTSSEFIVHPRYFKYISRAMRYDGRETSYDRLGVGEDYLPIVNMTWESRAYSYKLLYVGKKNMKFFLTNPQHVLPQLREVEENRKKFIEVYNDYVQDLTELVSPAAEEAGKECHEVKKEPRVVHTNVPIVAETNEGCVESIRQVVNLVNRKCKKRPDTIIIPTETIKAFEVSDVPDFHYELIETHLPQLVTGFKPTTDLHTYMTRVNEGLDKIGSEHLRSYVAEHLTGVFNRWLVECRFYHAVKTEGTYIFIDNILEDFEELIDVLKTYKDNGSLETLSALSTESFLVENLTMFASKKRQVKFIEEKLKGVDDSAMREAKLLSLNASVLIHREFVIAHVDPMLPLEPQPRVVMEGSQHPEIQWVLAKAPSYGQKHFGLGRNVPVVVMFSQDVRPIMWTTTFSPFCPNKFTLRPITLNRPLSLLKVS